MGLWDRYYEAVGEKPGRLVVGTYEKFGRDLRKRAALDLGAGNLRDSKYLLSVGFESVTAVDREAPPKPVEGVAVIISPLEQYFPMINSFDFVLCSNTLFYFSEDAMLRVITRAYNALAHRGVLAFNLLGDKDDWVMQKSHGVYGHRQERLVRILDGMGKLYMHREQGPRNSALGVLKYWDIWNIQIQK